MTVAMGKVMPKIKITNSADVVLSQGRHLSPDRQELRPNPEHPDGPVLGALSAA